MEKFSEVNKVFRLVVPQDIGTADIDSTVFVPAADYLKFRGILTSGALTSGQTATIQLLQAQDAAGTGKKALGTAVVYTAPAEGGNADAEQEAFPSDLDAAGGFTHVGVRAGSSVNSKLGAALLECECKDAPPA